MIEGQGWYIDLTNGEVINVHEHAYDIVKNPQKFRVNPREVAGLDPSSDKDRDKIRRLVLHRGFARVRAHANSLIVEFDVKLEDALPIITPWLIENFDQNTYVAFQNVLTHKIYSDLKISDLEDQEKMDQILGPLAMREHKSIKLSALYEDYDVTPVGSRKYATGTEKLVRGPKSGAGTGVRPPEAGDLSRISDVGSDHYTKDTIKPSEKPRKGQQGQKHPPL